jgi:hypothetical protein
MAASSQDLHPRSGARFHFDREGEGYRVVAYLPDGVRLEGVLAWSAGAGASGAAIEPPLSPPWVHEEALKLARVLHREPRSKLMRWRPAPP